MASLGQARGNPNRSPGENGAFAWDLRHFVRGTLCGIRTGKRYNCPSVPQTSPRLPPRRLWLKPVVKVGSPYGAIEHFPQEDPVRAPHIPLPGCTGLCLLETFPDRGNRDFPLTFPDLSPREPRPFPDLAMAPLPCQLFSPYGEASKKRTGKQIGSHLN